MPVLPNVGSLPSVREQLASTSRYELLVKIASGGMATVYVGRLSAAEGFRRLVAIKRAHAHLLEDPAFKRMLIREAKLASMIHHPNVVAVQDVEELEGDLLLVMEYIEGASLAELTNRREDEGAGGALPARLVVRIALDVCAGLHAAHEQRDDDNRALNLVHRDISPHNILVGLDGMSRITDFGIAKSNDSSTGASRTETGQLRGKVGYMAPEYIQGKAVDARVDQFALGVVLWEALARRRLFRGATDLETLQNVLASPAPRLSSVASWLGKSLDDVLARALEKSPEKRFASAQELGAELERAARREGLLGTHAEVSKHLSVLVRPALDARRTLIRSKTKSASTPVVEAPAPPLAEPGPTMTLPLSATDPSPPPEIAPDAASAPAPEEATSDARDAPRSERTDTRARGALTRSEASPGERPQGRRGRWLGSLAAVAVAAALAVVGFGVLRGRGSNVTPVSATTPAPEEATRPLATSVPSATTAERAAPAPVPSTAPSVAAPPAAERSASAAAPSAPPRVVHPAGRAAPSSRRTAPPNPYGEGAH